MKIYISGPIAGKDYRNRFAIAETVLARAGHAVANPARVATPDMTREEYLEATGELLDMCDTMLMLNGWQCSEECNAELARAIQNKMIITFEGGRGCQSPSRQEHGTSRKKPVKKFIQGIMGAFSARKGTTSHHK